MSATTGAEREAFRRSVTRALLGRKLGHGPSSRAGNGDDDHGESVDEEGRSSDTISEVGGAQSELLRLQNLVMATVGERSLSSLQLSVGLDRWYQSRLVELRNTPIGGEGGGEGGEEEHRRSAATTVKLGMYAKVRERPVGETGQSGTNLGGSIRLY